MFSIAACAQREITYEDACKLFHVGMSAYQIEKAYGKPQFKDKLGDIVVWNYYPNKKIDAARSGEFIGYTVDFRNGKALKISPALTVIK
ncbi:MAG: hypothetical protein ABI273_01705 [Lacunisphaera sp.]